MSLRDIKIRPRYRSGENNFSVDFFSPVLAQSVKYDRAVGYFSSTALVEISKGICQLVKNGGKIRIIASPYLSPEDYEAISKGYANRNTIVEKALIKNLNNTENYFDKERLNLLANLISSGSLDLKIALTEDVNSLYHEKFGLMEDSQGNVIAFSGSLNETINALIRNYESIDVYKSWDMGSDSERVSMRQDDFDRLWNNQTFGVYTRRFESVEKQIVERYLTGPSNINIDDEQLEAEKQPTAKGIPCQPKGFQFYDYQNEAIDNFLQSKGRGIFDMATGTGKTYTALGAITALSKRCFGKLGVVIVAPFQHLVEQWVKDIEKFNLDPIIAYSASQQKNWPIRMQRAIEDFQRAHSTCPCFCVITTNATFRTKRFQSIVSSLTESENVLLVVDEAHNFGSENLRTKLNTHYKYRLALSATLDRYSDPEGTQALYDYFGEKCISYGLAKAIEEGFLTPYYYYPVLVSLNEYERDEYEKLTKEIGQYIRQDTLGRKKITEAGKFKLIERARLIAGAQAKVEKLLKEILPYKNKNNILVYCGTSASDSDKNDYLEVDDSEIRQIDEVVEKLDNLGMNVAKFTSEKSSQQREELIKQFSKGDYIQALVAIKCLDEGVSISGIQTAFILASSTNPKEYIQRRGRVLRKAAGKKFAEIYDFITMPFPPDAPISLVERKLFSGLIKREFLRFKEFSDLSINSLENECLYSKLCDQYSIALDSKERDEYE